MKWLTKSDYLKYLASPAYLWLAKHEKHKLPPFDEMGQFLVAQGNEIETYARRLFPDGQLVTSKFSDAVSETQSLIGAGASTIFQASVLTDRRLFCAADVLQKQPDGSWNIYEVKSSTSDKTLHQADLAFQRVAFEEAGYQIDQTFLMHINNQYVRQGEIDAEELFETKDLTEAVETLLPRTRKGIESALKVIALPTCPSLDPAHSSDYYAWRDIYRHLHPEISDDSIYNLCRLNIKLLRKFAKRGITRLQDITPDIALGPEQLTQVITVKAGHPTLHPLKIAHRLGKLKWPLYFLDYETVFPALPAYGGTRPYQQIPFQYSLHILVSPAADLSQKEFLARGSQNPMPELLKHLSADIGPEGSVIVWNKRFEMSVNSGMAAHYPVHAQFLRGVNKRVFDLMEVFSKGLYADAQFFGSASIKKVLPVLVPELSYQSLGISEGGTASRKWYQTATGKISGSAAEQIYTDLLEYCGQDTLAMVRIYEFLSQLVKEKIPEQISML